MQDPGNGTIPENMVVGRAFMIVWPPSRWRVLPIPATFEQPGIERAPARTGPAAATRAQAAPYLPLEAGFAVAVPLTWLQRRLRLRASGAARSAARRGPRRRGDATQGGRAAASGLHAQARHGLTGYERVLARAGLAPVAGIDEAGRGACAGPLVVAAVLLDPRPGRRLAGWPTPRPSPPAARENAYDEVVARPPWPGTWW